MPDPNEFSERLRRRERLVGYWMFGDSVAGAERIAGLGYDYVCVDAQHGLMDERARLAALTAVDGRATAALVRVPAVDFTAIGRALDAGARGVVVPMVDSAHDARAAVEACRYPPYGRRSFGPMRAGLRIGPDTRQANAAVSCTAMIETATGLDNVEEICAVEGLDAVYVGPTDLTLALGGSGYGDPEVATAFAAALERVLGAAERNQIAAGVHCADGVTASKRIADGFTWAGIGGDLDHLEAAAAQHLRDAAG